MKKPEKGSYTSQDHGLWGRNCPILSFKVLAKPSYQREAEIGNVVENVPFRDYPGDALFGNKDVGHSLIQLTL